MKEAAAHLRHALRLLDSAKASADIGALVQSALDSLEGREQPKDKLP